MTRLFIDRVLSAGDVVALPEDAAHYLLRVLRRQPGDSFILVATDGREHVATLEPGDDPARARIIESREPVPAPVVSLVLYPALLKGKHFDLVIQKAVELGVAEIVPVITRRTISRPEGERVEGRLTRWSKIAQEACRQCGRGETPSVAEPLIWRDALADWRGRGIPGIIPYEALARDPQASIKRVLAGIGDAGGIAVFIGPEGGFAPSEIEEALSAGLAPVSLGPRILRAETASIAVCAIVMNEMESPQ
ncbi:MAG: 16S rRNA (uracil(1498)-N(3))-methyltransferase [Armatimonadetes bacterium]|jgi:16S rRNA (uracil1498-N3)-methyltransferase|nr:16S rRNA (uracil(1498)-N(3))-methyltransferase [Armatimonadota bacterium]